MTQKIKKCDECGSLFLAYTSKMFSMCPECASIIYSYEPCEHEFKNNKCMKCGWDGSTSDYINGLKALR